MRREITQRQLRNESGAIMRAIDAGESFIVYAKRCSGCRNDACSPPTLHLEGGCLEGLQKRAIRRREAILFRYRCHYLTEARRLVADGHQRGFLDNSIIVDIEIAAISFSEALPLYTRNPADFHNLVSIVDIEAL
jgi:hypothetical protein